MNKTQLIIIIYVSGVVLSFIGFMINRKTKFIENTQYSRYDVFWMSTWSWICILTMLITCIVEGKLKGINKILTPFEIVGNWFKKEF